jgi:hypothetical protein
MSQPAFVAISLDALLESMNAAQTRTVPKFPSPRIQSLPSFVLQMLNSERAMQPPPCSQGLSNVCRLQHQGERVCEGVHECTVPALTTVAGGTRASLTHTARYFPKRTTVSEHELHQ